MRTTNICRRTALSRPTLITGVFNSSRVSNSVKSKFSFGLRRRKTLPGLSHKKANPWKCRKYESLWRFLHLNWAQGSPMSLWVLEIYPPGRRGKIATQCLANTETAQQLWQNTKMRLSRPWHGARTERSGPTCLWAQHHSTLAVLKGPSLWSPRTKASSQTDLLLGKSAHKRESFHLNLHRTIKKEKMRMTIDLWRHI